MTPEWRLAAESEHDPDAVVRLSAQMDLPTLEVDLTGADGLMSPEHARRLAAALMDAADYAESCIKNIGEAS